MKTTVLGVRLNDYHREQLKKIAKENEVSEVELVRILIDKLIEGKIQIKSYYQFEGVNIDGLKRQAEERGVSVQTLVDAIVEQLDETSRAKRK